MPVKTRVTSRTVPIVVGELVPEAELVPGVPVDGEEAAQGFSGSNVDFQEKDTDALSNDHEYTTEELEGPQKEPAAPRYEGNQEGQEPDEGLLELEVGQAEVVFLGIHDELISVQQLRASYIPFGQCRRENTVQLTVICTSQNFSPPHQFKKIL